MRRFFATALVLLAVFSVTVIAADPTILRFYFPVGVAGPLARYMGELADEFIKLIPKSSLNLSTLAVIQRLFRGL
ncbi:MULTISPECIES: hypothetical protein [unclassified Mesotoga]|uniref:hypothetical protein n=1 Tax=unclassified Mesotoga TaxID=1184398 RepID=UPI000EF257F3|nr:MULTISPECIES: hypothetical protein [unclassified Mesotoga]MDD3681888.1 hypothetical protein [Mesotoga sp.]